MSSIRTLIRYVSKISFPLVILLLLSSAKPAQQSNTAKREATSNSPEARKLELNKPIERDMKGGETHTYEIELATKQYLDLSVEQKGIDVIVQVISPSGKQLSEVDSPNGNKGPEPVKLIAETTGSYKIKVVSLEKDAPAGRYEIRIKELRGAVDKDREVIEKEALLMEATKLLSEVVKLSREGKYDAAIPLAERSLAIREKVLGADHQLTGGLVNTLAALYDAKGDYAKAEPFYVRTLAIFEKVFGAENPSTSTALNNLGWLYYRMGDYAKAEPFYLRALAIREKVLGAEHAWTVLSLNNLGELYRTKGDFAKAEPLYIRALAASEKGLGAEHPMTSTSLNNLGLLYHDKGDYAKAEPLLLRSLAIREKVLGAEHPWTAISLINLAELYDDEGDYTKAEPLLARALAIREKILGAEHPETAGSLDTLAGLYMNKGDFAKAEPLYVRALAIREKTLGTEHPATATSLNNLALLFFEKGDYAKAESLYLRALAISEKAHGAEHPSTASHLHNLGGLFYKTGDYAKAEPLFIRAISILEKVLGKEHPSVATSLHMLALVYYKKGDYAKAEPLLLRSLAIREKAQGTEHPRAAKSLYTLARVYQATGNYSQAIASQSRCNEISERDFIRNLISGSEHERLLYLQQTSAYFDYTLSLHTQAAPNDLLAREMALRVLLQRKGRVLDATTDAIAALRRRASPDDQKLLDQLTLVRSQLSNALLKGSDKEDTANRQEKLKNLTEQAEKLEVELSRRSSEFRAQALPVTLEAVRAVVPNDAVLVEFASFRPYEAKSDTYGEPRYIVYLLTNTGEVKWADIGEAAKIDSAVKAFRMVLQQTQADIRGEVLPKARALDELIMRPVRALAGGKKRLLISPDGALNLVPFEALADEHNQYLVENYSISYLTSGRDLLRLQAAKPNSKAALVIADPDFDGGITPANGKKAKTRLLQREDAKQNDEERIAQRAVGRPGPRLGDVQLRPFARLSGSAKEGEKLKKLLPDATVLTATEATETALKRASSPSILHISTHGGFLEDKAAPQSNDQRVMLIRADDDENLSGQLSANKDPLLRSGLFFAGANIGKSGDDDGVLTALEAASLDLYGTKLVVLSACDTGVGEVKNGDGVYGLRRALVLAGSETQVMSLWPVSDEGTRKLMVDYYKRLLKGEGRGEALREARLKMLESKHRRHPYYWASFIQSGEWANLDGKR